MGFPSGMVSSSSMIARRFAEQGIRDIDAIRLNMTFFKHRCI